MSEQPSDNLTVSDCEQPNLEKQSKQPSSVERETLAISPGDNLWRISRASSLAEKQPSN
jgi:hypothetical protein